MPAGAAVFARFARVRRTCAVDPSVRARLIALAAVFVAGVPCPALADSCGTNGLPPLKVLERRSPEYPDGARSVGLEGFVDVEFTVLRDGLPGWVRIRRADPAGLFEQAALDAVYDWRFEPVRVDDTAVECAVATRVRFTLSDEVMPGASGTDGPGRPMPTFPEAARAAGVEGYVRVEYGVDADGRVADLAIVESIPRGTFDDAVRTALSAWRYSPGTGPGRRASREFRFRLPAYARPEPTPQNTPSAYPAELCARKLRGRVILDVDLDVDGRVKTARVASAEPRGAFEKEALRIAPQLRRTPVRRGGLAVAGPGRLTLDFDPERHCESSGEPSRLPRGGRAPRVGALR
jgi:TonB family protein